MVYRSATIGGNSWSSGGVRLKKGNLWNYYIIYTQLEANNKPHIQSSGKKQIKGIKRIKQKMRNDSHISNTPTLFAFKPD
jgi:hypothetical protein